jgi:hypothetical protein
MAPGTKSAKSSFGLRELVRQVRHTYKRWRSGPDFTDRGHP